MTWTRGTPALQAAAAWMALESMSGWMSGLLQRQHRFEIGQGHLADDVIADTDAIVGGDEHQLGRLERLGDRQRHAIGVDTVGLALAVKPERRHHGMMSVIEQLAGASRRPRARLCR